MNAVLKTLEQHLEVGNRLYPKGLEDLSYEELHRRGGPGSSSILWIAGHLLAARTLMLRLLGRSLEIDWLPLFGRGVELRPPEDYPSVEEMLKWWEQVSKHLSAELHSVSEERLEKTSPEKFPVADPSILGGLAFLGYHEGYHLGQMSYLRRLWGYPGLAG